MSQLINHYRKAHSEVLGVSVWVKDGKHFHLQEKRLSKQGIFPGDFSQNILLYLKGWIESKGWKSMPVNLFCGKWAFDLYVSKGLCSVPKSSKSALDFAQLVYQELMVARLYITTDAKFSQAMQQIEQFLGIDWMNAYEARNRYPIIQQALEVLKIEYNTPLADSYEQIKSMLNS